MRGFIQGSLWALIVGGVGLSLTSVVSESPERFAAGPATPQLVAPELDAVNVTPSVSLPNASEDTPSFAAVAPLEPASESSDATPVFSVEPATPPQTVDVATLMETPDALPPPELDNETDAPIAATAGTAPSTTLVAPSTAMTDAPAVPDATPEIVTAQDSVVVEIMPDTGEDTPQQDTVADAPLITILDTPVEGTNDIIVNEDPAVTDTPVQEAAPTSDPTDSNTQDAGVEELAVTEVVPDEAVAPEPEPAVTQETVADVGPEVVEPQLDEPVQEPATVTQTPAPVAVTPQVVQLDDAPTEALPQTNTGVRVNRPSEDTTGPAEAETADAEVEYVPAISRYATAFENPGDVPLISIILLDEGAPDGPSAVADLGFVPTVVVDALAVTAFDTAAAYRAAGLEVAMQIALPSGAQPTDIEVAFEAAFGIVPQAAMFFSDGTGVVQDNRTVTAQVMEILAADGHGFVTVQRGLGNAVRAAAQESVPAATILRDLDGSGEDPRAMTRALDQAAFRARQSGGAILMGRVTPQTLDVLRDWAATIDPEELLIAPVSAVLLDQQE